MSRLTVDAIVVSFNTRDLLRSCLASLADSSFAPRRVFVVDNASVDGSLAMVRSEFPDVTVIEMPRNIGFARANNVAFRQVRADAVLLLNPDAEVGGDTIAVLAAALAADEQVAAVGPVLVDADGRVQFEGARRDPSLIGEFANISHLNRRLPHGMLGRDRMSDWDHRSDRDVEVLSGACMLIRTAVLEERLFDDEFYMYVEDVELCQRLRSRGWRLRYCGDTEVVHSGAAATGAARTRMRIAGVASMARLFARRHGAAYAGGYLAAVAVAWPLGVVVRRLWPAPASVDDSVRAREPDAAVSGTVSARREPAAGAPPGATVVLVNNYPGPGLGGGEVQLVQLIGGCVAAGLDVRLVCVANEELEREASRSGAVVVRRPLEPARLVAAARWLRGYLRQSGAAIVQGTGYATNVLGREAARGLSLRVVNTVHVEPEASLLDGGSRLGLRLRDAVDRAGRGRVDGYVAVSDTVRDALIARGVPATDVVVVRNGVDVAELRGAAAAPPPPGTPREPPLVGVVARLEPVKGVESFVRAVAELASEHPEARFVVGGSGSQERALRDLAAELGVQDRITWLGIVRPAAPLLATFDVVVVPSRSEGSGIVALEAMALARPVVATVVGGLPEVVVDGETGLLVAPRDHVALARAVGALLSDPARARALGEAGLRRVETEFTVERMVAGYLALYERLLDRTDGVA